MDRDKLISALHCRGQDLMIDPPPCDGCKYQVQLVNYIGCDYRQLCRDAIALMNEQEAVEPKTGRWIYKKHYDMFMCSSCEKYSVRNDYPYCHWCGAKMRREGR